MAPATGGELYLLFQLVAMLSLPYTLMLFQELLPGTSRSSYSHASHAVQLKHMHALHDADE